MKHFIILSLLAIIALLLPIPGTFLIFCAFVPCYLIFAIVISKAIRAAKREESWKS